MVDAGIMSQDERRLWLIRALLAERPDGLDVGVPAGADAQRELLRALMNVRDPLPVGEEFLVVQDRYLRERAVERGIVRPHDLVPLGSDGVDAQLTLWQGDITTLAADVIVNAANSQMLGCFVPGHHCIDNAIHTYAGVQLRLECSRIMRERARPEPTGTATLTGAYNLPSRCVAHTVGPIVASRPGPREELLLRRCYRSCLEAAAGAGCGTIAFCCISTGVFHYPNEDAARVATDEVRTWLRETASSLRVIFNVFLERDLVLYRSILAG